MPDMPLVPAPSASAAPQTDAVATPVRSSAASAASSSNMPIMAEAEADSVTAASGVRATLASFSHPASMCDMSRVLLAAPAETPESSRDVSASIFAKAAVMSVTSAKEKPGTWPYLLSSEGSAIAPCTTPPFLSTRVGPVTP